MIVHTPLIGRFGNQCFQYAHAKALCEKNGWTLSTPPWVGEKIFQIPEAVRSANPDKTLGGYCQNQESLNMYSRKWLLNTLKLRPEIQEKLDSVVPHGQVCAHQRIGDYAALGYPIVSDTSYMQAVAWKHYDPGNVYFVTEETPMKHPDFTGELSFLPDFYRMMRAKALFRGNSSFSWWAGALGEARVFSPCIKGKKGGVESDCGFSEGNHEQLAELPDQTDLHLFKNEDRYDYPLNEDSTVIDAGGYEGDFTAEVRKRYNCFVNVWEPCREFYDALCQRFAGHADVLITPYALGGDERSQWLGAKGSMSGIYADGAKQPIEVKDISETWIGYEPIDLLKLNIEGMEFEVLERILKRGLVDNFKNIQVQFHGVVPNAAERYASIREGLNRTHRLTYDEPWCWQNWELRV